jgi:hypothetical protein
MKTSCPDEERLMDYFKGRLSEEDSSQLEAHLAECEDCLEAFVLVKHMVANMDQFKLESVPTNVTEAAVNLVLSQRTESSGIVERLKRSIKEMASRLTDTLQRPWGVLQPVPIRGSETCESEGIVCHTFSFKGITADIEIEEAGNAKVQIRVQLAEDTWRIRGIRVTLKKGDREIASYRLQGPYVVFEDIPFGRYAISLTENGAQLGTYHFEVKDNRNGGK